MYDLDSILQGFTGILQWKPLLLMTCAVVLSSIFAALPGVGSSTLLAMALPFAMTLSPYECIALLFGITIISNTANTFPSVLIAVPGGSGSQATIVDDHPMARNGEASRTKVVIAGKQTKRKNLKPGMACEISYAGNGSEAVSVTCD